MDTFIELDSKLHLLSEDNRLGVYNKKYESPNEEIINHLLKHNMCLTEIDNPNVPWGLWYVCCLKTNVGSIFWCNEKHHVSKGLINSARLKLNRIIKKHRRQK